MTTVISYTDGETSTDAVVLDSDDVELEVTTGSATQAGAITQSGGFFGFSKTGSGTLISSAANTYDGSTVVLAGTLLINGSITGDTTVGIDTTFGGTGTVGDVTVQGVLSPGDDTGTLTTGSLGFSQGSALAVHVSATAFGQLSVVGAVYLEDATLSTTLLSSDAVDETRVITIIENDGSDAINGQFGNYGADTTVFVGSHTTAIDYTGGDGNDVVLTIYASRITGTTTDDVVDAATTIAGELLPTGRPDLIRGRTGDDRLSGLGGRDVIFGGHDDDVIRGGAGSDILKGGTGNDRIIGGAGGDVLNGGRGEDRLIGRDGIDTFVFRHRGDADKIADYKAGEILEVARNAFPDIGPKGVLTAQYFHVGAEAETSDQHILYDPKSGWLLYARHGSETHDPEALVKIGKHLDGFDHHAILVI